jgi:hypothetical protein
MQHRADQDQPDIATNTSADSKVKLIKSHLEPQSPRWGDSYLKRDK